MKKIITGCIMIMFTLLLTGCGERVEQQTLTCFDTSGEEVKIVVEEDRLISYEGDGEYITREEDYDRVLELEFFIKEELDTDSMFDFISDLQSEVELMDDDITCTLESKKVTFIEFEGDEISSDIIATNMAKDDIISDGLKIENAAKLYCSQTTCASNQELTWTELKPYTQGIDEDYYDFTNNTGIIAIKTTLGWTVDIEADGTGQWEILQGSVPSQCDRDCVIEDID